MITMIDWLSYTVKTLNYDSVIGKYEKDLEEAKAKEKIIFQERMKEKSIIQIGKFAFEVMPTGNAHYAYILKNDFFDISLCKKENRNYYPIFIHISSLALWSYGIENSINIVNTWLQETFGNIVADKVNRVDLCCHTDEDISYDRNQYRTRAKTSGYILHSDVETIYKYNEPYTIFFGSRKTQKIYARIYNKTEEIKISNKPWFKAIWLKNNLNVEKITNIEFELRRKFFNESYISEKRIDTVQDFLDNIKIIWEYLTTKWLVMLDSTEYTRSTREKVSPIWLRIQQAFNTYNGNGQISRKLQNKSNADLIFKRLRASMVSLAELENVESLEELFTYILHKNEKYEKENKTVFSNDVKNKKILKGL